MSQAAELELYPQINKGGSLSDGVRIATGRIVCRDAHSGFHIWINAQKAGDQSEYIIKGKTNSKHEIRVRLGGYGWTESKVKEQYGMVRSGTEERAIFDVFLDGEQYVDPDEYVLSVHGLCL